MRPLPGFHYLRGDLFARMGRLPEAEKEFLAAIRELQILQEPAAAARLRSAALTRFRATHA